MYLEIPRRKFIRFKYLSFLKNRYYFFIFILFSLIFILSSINVFNSLATSGIEPFLSINRTLAQYTSNFGDYLPTTSSKEGGLFQVIDNWGRCQVINPTSNIPIRTASEVASGNSRELASKAGINQGDTNQHGAQINFIDQNNLNMSYLLSIEISSGADPTNFIKETYDKGFMPIIRLCFDGGCNFDLSSSAASIISFYENINNNLSGTDYQFIGVVGPNEPGTGNEMGGFNVSDYATLVARANEAASALQDFRVENGGNMYIAPAIFNLSNRKGDDAKEYLNPTDHESIDPSLFDYILGNTYDLKDGSAVKWYEESGAKAYIEANDNLKMIFTEFGFFPSGLSNVETLKESYKTLCEDETVDGIMFFRPNHELLFATPPRQDPVIPLEDMIDMIESCDATPSKTSQRNSSWYSCNFDSCVSNSYTYSEKSIATPVASFTPTVNNQKAWLKVKCDSEKCFTQQTNTMQIYLPIKSLASTTASNSARFKTFTPVCASLASQIEVSGYDPLNQFAGKLSSGSDIYPMPWLGSLINCIAEFSLSTTEFASDFSTLNPNYHPFSKILESSVETYQDIIRGLAGEVDSGLETHTVRDNNVIYIPDEKTVCLKNTETGWEYCFDNDKSLDIIASFRAYDPFLTPGVYYKVQKSDGGDLIFLKNKDDFLPGPEVVIDQGDINNMGSGSDMCWHYGQRTIDGNIKNNFRAQRGVTCQVLPLCYYLFQNRGFATSLNFNGSNYDIIKASALDKAFQSGKFDMDSAYNPCFSLIYDEKINMEFATGEYASVAKYDIEGIYDALYRSYQRLQTIMSERLLEIKFGEDIGWEVKVDSIIRDNNRTNYYNKTTGEFTSYYDKFGDYLYKGTDKEYNTQMCEPIDFYDNTFGKASGSNTKTRYDYYSYLGYLDVIQEWLMAYTSNTTLPAEDTIENPFYNPSDSTLPNYNKPKVLVSGMGNKFLSFPIQTCDEINICKKYSNLELKEKLKTFDKYSSLSEDKLDALVTSWCPIPEKLDENKDYTCVDTYDLSSQDNLSKFLCEQGYDLGLDCEVQCKGTPVSKAVCPLPGNHACFQGPNGSYTHCNSEGLPLDLYTPFVGIDPQDRDRIVVSPENGKVIEINQGKGKEVVILGESGITYYILHLQDGTLPSVGDQVSAGQEIGLICSDCYDYENWHIHVRATYDGKDIDPYTLYGEILGCNVLRPTSGLKENDPITESGMCFKASNNGLHDNSALCSKEPGIDNDTIRSLFSNTNSTVSQTANSSCVIDNGVSGGSEFDGIDCLIKSVATYISENVNDGVPAAMLKATMVRESSLHSTISYDESGNRNIFTGDPAEITHNVENEATAMGPMQFTRDTWAYIIQKYEKEILGCTESLGLKVVGLSLEHRSYVGIALCAGALKHLDDVKSDPTYDGLGKFVPASSWGQEEVYAAAFNYFGRCDYQYGSVKGNYCEEVYNYFNQFKSQLETLNCTRELPNDGPQLPIYDNPYASGDDIEACNKEGLYSPAVLSVPGYTVKTSAMQAVTEERKKWTCDTYGSQLIEEPKAVIIHWTASGLQESINTLTNVVSYNSLGEPYLGVGIQFIVDLNGDIYQIAPLPNYTENHATGFSWISLGIENVGRDKLTNEQIEANKALIRALKSEFPSIEFVINHEQADNFAYAPGYEDIKSIIRTPYQIGCKGDVDQNSFYNIAEASGLKFYRTTWGCNTP